MPSPTDPPPLALFGRLADLPPDAAALLGADGFFSSLPWWRTVEQAGLAPGLRPCYALVGPATRPLALFALARAPDGSLAALSNPYTCLYQPALAPGLAPADIAAAGRALGRLARAGAPARLDALDPGWPALAPLLAGTRRAGLVPLRFAHFGNWHEALAGRDWAAYLAARPGALRETVRRRLRAAERDPAVAWRVATGPAGLDDAIAAYEDVYARSWKEPEPFPAFNATLMREAAAAGLLRLGLLAVADRPVAVQLWIVWQGTAMVLKLAHDEAYKPHSPGTVLTALMLRRLIEEERVQEIDFGRGDDPYKRAWASHRRPRIGVVLANPLRPAGLLAIAAHFAGSARRRLAALRESRAA